MNMDAIRDGLTQAFTSVAAFTPKLLAALVILIVGWLVAKLIRTVALRILTAVHFDDVISRAGVDTAAERSGYDAKNLVAGVAYWIILFVTFQLAAETLGATTLALMLASLVSFLPLVLVAVAIVLVALALAQFVAGAIRANLGERGSVGARIAYWAIVSFGAIAALNQVNIAPEVVNAVLYAVLGTLAVTAAIAFGVGGIPTARRMVDQWVERSDAAAFDLDDTQADLGASYAG